MEPFTTIIAIIIAVIAFAVAVVAIVKSSIQHNAVQVMLSELNNDLEKQKEQQSMIVDFVGIQSNDKVLFRLGYTEPHSLRVRISGIDNRTSSVADRLSRLESYLNIKYVKTETEGYVKVEEETKE